MKVVTNAKHETRKHPGRQTWKIANYIKIAF
jgi:hypothetical protein